MVCIACRNRIDPSDLLKCVSCKGTYHYKCLNIGSAAFRENSNKMRQTWQCDGCKNVSRRRRNDNTPLRKGQDLESDESIMTSVNQDSGSSPSLTNVEKINSNPNSVLAYEDFDKLLNSRLGLMEAAITKNITLTIQSEINSAIEKLKAEFTQTTDFLAAEQTDLKQEIDSAHKTIQSLEAENSKLSSELAYIGKRMRTLEKASRSCNAEIHGIPEKRGENVLNILNKLCDEIKIEIPDGAICAVRRVAKLNPSSERPRNVLITLSSERHRDSLISSVRRYNKDHVANPLNSGQVGVTGEKRRIYVVEHLSPETKELHAVARKFAKDHSFKYVWVKYDRVYLRKCDESPAIHVKDSGSFSKLL